MIRDVDWLNVNESRSYPIHTGSDRELYLSPSLGDFSGETLPDSLFVDFRSTTYGKPNIYLYVSRVTIAGDKVSVHIDGFDSNMEVMSTSVIKRQRELRNLVTYPSMTGSATLKKDEYVTVDLTPNPRTPLITGRMVFGRLHDNLLNGNFYLSPEGGLIEPCLISTGPKSVTSIRVGDSKPLTGDVELISGNNVTIHHEPRGKNIVISAIPGSGYITGVDPQVSNIVRTINGIPLEDVIITGDGDCVSVITEGNNIKITDKCSTPCCGSDELEYLTDKLIELNTRLEEIGAYNYKLDQAVNQLSAAVGAMR